MSGRVQLVGEPEGLMEGMGIQMERLNWAEEGQLPWYQNSRDQKTLVHCQLVCANLKAILSDCQPEQPLIAQPHLLTTRL